MKKNLIIVVMILVSLAIVRMIIPCSTIAAVRFLSGNMVFLKQRIILDENFAIVEGIHEYKFEYLYDVPQEIVLFIPKDCSLKRYNSDGSIKKYHFDLAGTVDAGNKKLVSFSTQDDIAFAYNNYKEPNNFRFYIADFNITPMCRLYKLLGRDMEIKIDLMNIDDSLADCTAVLEIRAKHP